MSRQKPMLRETDDEARAVGQDLLRRARFGSLGVICPDSNAPMVSRVSVGTDAAGMPVTLISDLSLHTTALARNPLCSLLVGEPGARGDALIHPRLTLQCTAEPVDKDEIKPLYLSQHPKATLYYDFSDFRMLRLTVTCAHLNGGFGKAFSLSPADLDLPNPG
ncbi:HugZ family pyridoxamine 5'-phosphate oxidase [Nioella nitratireducens]|uniref:HugZ family pyridoxamine 5'-phosphate oxidase n=1 Tax=Nioella nitratireducens TaxID=1287720 RepID=UPI0008FD7846|nr:pyridoxamine 5'-phosphate oxidase family protein [Nioella nitratireducens]